MRTPPALLIDRETVAEVLPLAECLEVVEDAFKAHARGEALGPGFLHGDGGAGEFHIKAGGFRSPEAVYACKVNSSYFGNAAAGTLPSIQGLVLLYDASDGRPLAVMESGILTQRRTAAATAVAARCLARPDARVATLVGAGRQAGQQARALMRVRDLDTIHVWSRDPARAGSLARELREELGIHVDVAPDLEAATRSSPIVVTCTPARRWLLGRSALAPGAFVAAIGADSPEKQEIEPELLASAAVVTDITSQCARVGELHHALEAGLMTERDVRGELGQVLVGAAAGRRSPEEIVVFDSTGTALQDAAAAARVYSRARALGRGTPFPFWG